MCVHKCVIWNLKSKTNVQKMLIKNLICGINCAKVSSKDKQNQLKF